MLAQILVPEMKDHVIKSKKRKVVTVVFRTYSGLMLSVNSFIETYFRYSADGSSYGVVINPSDFIIIV